MLLTVGLLTGLSHCVGMCGPMVGAFALRRQAAHQEVSTPLALFQLGRLTLYVLFGISLGGLGSLIQFGSMLQGWQGGLTVLFGLLVVIMGLGLIGWLPLRGLFESMALARLVVSFIRKLFTSTHPFAPFVLGMANGLLPCGAVYSMSLLAAISGNPLQGGLIMLLFGLGTLLPLLAVGFSASLLSIRLRQGLFRAAAGLVLMTGTQLILRGLAASGWLPHLALGGAMLW
jgi:sulfite exporter TauE/SafE